MTRVFFQELKFSKEFKHLFFFFFFQICLQIVSNVPKIVPALVTSICFVILKRVSKNY